MVKSSVYMASAQLRILASIALAILCLALAPGSHAANKKIDLDTYDDPDVFVAQLADYATFSEPELTNAVGNIIGHMTGMFVRYPQKIDVWLENVQHPRLEVFAILALGLADHQDEAIAFAKTRTIEATRIASVMNYYIGDAFVENVSEYEGVPIKHWLDLHGMFNNTAQHAPWRQDILWSIAFVLRAHSKRS